MIKLEFEDIGEYLEFMELQINLSLQYRSKNSERREDNELWLKNNSLDENIVDLWEEIGVLSTQINNNGALIKSDKSDDTFRKYSPSTYNSLPIIKDLKSDGYFILGSGRRSNYHINDVLKLRELIYTKKSWHKISEELGVSEVTAKKLGYMIEKGIINKWLDKWKVISNTIDKKDVLIVNNPEKRKELMGMG